MPARQLRFFEHPKPLLERLGPDFFQSVPARPGVYIMSGETGLVLYVGQSKNLRVRLGTYKNANPDHVPRKVIGLVHAVQRIHWEECADAGLARARETELLRLFRPKYNSRNTYTKTDCFIGLSIGQSEMTLWFSTQASEGPNVYGPLKGRSAQAYAALLRLVWATLHHPSAPADFPHRLLSGRPPSRYHFSAEQMRARMEAQLLETSFARFFSGNSPELIDLLSASLRVAEELPPFLRTLQSIDLETLRDFYRVGPQRNQAINQLAP